MFLKLKRIRMFCFFNAVILALLSAACAYGSEEWIPFNLYPSVPSVSYSPELKIIESNKLETIVEVEFQGMWVENEVRDGIMFQKIRIPECGVTTVAGEPQMPVYSKFIAIPDDKNVEVRVIEEETASLPGFEVYPFQTPPLRNQGFTGAFEFDEDIYNYNGLIPAALAEIWEPAVIRDFRVVPLRIYPVRFNPYENRIVITKKIRIALEYVGECGLDAKRRVTGSYAAAFEPIYESFIANFEEISREYVQEVGALLIIVPDNLYNGIINLAKWKYNKGIPTTVTKLSQIGTNPTNTQIKNYISNAYYNWTIPPVYVLFVGDIDQIPVFTGIGGCPSDHMYSTLEGNDYLSDVHMGRFSVNNSSELAVVADKILRYESAPNLVQTAWYRKGTGMSGSDYVDDQNANTVRAILLANGYTGVDQFYTSKGNNNPTNISNAVNDGRTWVDYFGHGSATSWSSPNPSYTNSHVNALTNTDRLPVITSIACSNGSLDIGGACFAEAWQRAGSVGDSRGSAGIFAASRPCAFFYTDTLGRGVAKGFFNYKFHQWGAACTYGNYMMYQYFPESSGGTTEETMQMFINFGDPELNVWAGTPAALDVNYPETVVLGQVPVTVTVKREGQFLKNALVCLNKNMGEVYASGYTNAQGEVTLTIEPLSPGPMSLMVTGFNAIPFSATIQVITPTGPWIILDDYEIHDTAGGNGNGLIDYGESIELPASAKNLGLATGYSITGTLRSGDIYAVITDSIEDFGDILPGATAWSQEDFDFTVAPSCPDEHIIPLQLFFRDNQDSSWLSTFNLVAHAPELSISTFRIDDSKGGNGDGKADPGETVDVYVTVENQGTGDAEDVSALLETADPYITINTASAAYPDIPGSGGKHECVTPFNVTVDILCPDGHSAAFNLDMETAKGYTAQGTFKITVGGFFDDMESGQGEWTHKVITPGFVDQWHLETYRNHSSGGSKSWKFGGAGSSSYSNSADGGLVTPQIHLGTNSTLTFWHWIAAETYSSTVAWDGAVVEISTNGGSSWTQITPAGGYPYTIRDNPESPFSAGTPCFSGNHDWMLATFDLSSFSGAVNIRFRFGSDGYTTAEGWYIDDVAVYSNNPRLTLTVSETPAYVSPGELATWKVTISNLGNQTVADFWLEISPVIGYDAGYKFLLKEDFNIPKGYSGTSALKFKVPTSAKFGNFRVKNVIGQYPGSVYASDSFDVTVQ